MTCALGDLASGAGDTLTIVVTAEQAGALINTAEVSSTVADPDLANNTASVETEASEERFEADLSLMKTAPADVTVGSPFTYTLEVTNLGPDTAHTTILTDTLPTGVTFVSATSGCNEISGTVTCDLGDLGSGSSATITIVVTADVTGTQTNSAEVSSSITDPVPENNTAFTNTDGIAIPPPPEDEFWLYLPIVIRD